MPAFLVQYPARTGFPLPEGANTFAVFATDAANARAMAAGHFGGDADALMQSADMTVTEIVIAGSAEDAGYNMRVRVIDAADGDGNFFLETKAGESLAIDGFAIDNQGAATYVLDDILTVIGGTFKRAATFRVTSLDTGTVDGVELVDPGDYSVMPSLVANAVSGGGGSGVLLDLVPALAGSWAQVAAKMVTEINLLTGHDDAVIDLSENESGTRLFTVSSISDGFGDGTLTFEMVKNGVALPQLVSTLVDGGIAGAVLTAAIPAIPLAAARVTPLKS